jgi:hypothetical protein
MEASSPVAKVKPVTSFFFARRARPSSQAANAAGTTKTNCSTRLLCSHERICAHFSGRCWRSASSGASCGFQYQTSSDTITAAPSARWRQASRRVTAMAMNTAGTAFHRWPWPFTWVRL